MRKGKNIRTLFCVLIAITILGFLIVLPHAETEQTTASSETQTTENATTNSNSDETGNASVQDDTNIEKNADYTYQDDNMIVTAVLSDSSTVPENAELSVTPITATTDSTEYQEVNDEITLNRDHENQTVTGFLAYDICFMVDGVEYEPTTGDVTVTIQYKNEQFTDTVVNSADTVKVLHLKATDSGVEVEDLSDNANITTTADDDSTATDTVANSGTNDSTTTTSGDSVEFVTTSFSTFVVTGVTANSSPTVNVNMQFLTTAGIVDTSANGTYYLYVYLNGYRNTLTLNVANGTATATLSGLYDQNGNKQNNNNGALYPLTNATYTTYLFSSNGSTSITASGFRWDDNNYASQGFTKYEIGSRINSNYVVTSMSNVSVTNNAGAMTITATESPKPALSVSLQFLTTSGAVDTSANGTYYLNVQENSTSRRYTVTLTVTNGVATAKITGLYDQNGQKQNNNNGDFYALPDGSNYTATLFSSNGTTTVTDALKWDSGNYKNYGFTPYALNSEIADDYTITSFPNISISSGNGTLAITATAKAGTKYSSSQLLSAVSSVQPYAAFTNYLYLDSDMEGNIAAKSARLGHNFGNSSSNLSSSTDSTTHTFTVKKTYTGSTQKTFSFGLYKNATLVDTATITLPTSSGATTGSTTFTVYNGSDGYTVSELNSNGDPMSVGDQNDGYTLTSSDSATTSTASTTNSTSYVQNIVSCGQTALREGTSSIKNNLVVGSSYTANNTTDSYSVQNSGNSIRLLKNGNNIMTVQSNTSSITIADTFPIDFSGTLADMENLSTNLATALTSDTVMVKNYTYAQYQSKTNQDLTINTNGKMLVINIDATGQSNVDLNVNAKLIVNGASCAGFSSQANNIIVNIFTKSGSTYSPYSGNITNAGYVMGVLLAPDASVNSVGQNYNGTIVANYVKNSGGELHGSTVATANISTVYSIVNTAIETNFDLPEAGGVGTYAFTITGIALLLSASTALLIYQRKTKNKQVKNPLK